ncbi:MAG TPA: alpha/beta hydrolase [Acidimicrobiales bacterium]|nr:alpha/beta hydrolase [Acidimicrobiales bacterium]
MFGETDRVERNRFVVDPQAGALVGDRWGGSGPTAVFLHAGITDRRAWTATIEALGGKVAAIAYDRRGFGETPPAQSAFSQVDDLLAVLGDQGDGSPVWLVGNSAGGGIALEAACREPDRIAGLVLIAPAVTGAPDFTLDPDSTRLDEALEAADGRGDLDEVNRLELHLWLDGPAQPEGRVGGSARQLVEEMNRTVLANEQIGVQPTRGEPVWGRLGEIRQPVLVLCGSFDLPHLLARSRDLAAALPAGRYEDLPGTAHLPQLEQPDEVARRIAQLIN